MSSSSLCAPIATESLTHDFEPLVAKTNADAIERPLHWNPYSETCETLERMIERGRAERSKGIARWMRRWMRAVKTS